VNGRIGGGKENLVSRENDGEIERSIKMVESIGI
jgi:hypothetical protein